MKNPRDGDGQEILRVYKQEKCSSSYLNKWNNLYLSYWHMSEIKILLLYSIAKGVEREVTLIH